MIRSPHFRGYTRLGGELTRGQVDWREQIDIGPEREPIGGPGKPDYLWLQGPNQWPAGLPELPGIIARVGRGTGRGVPQLAAALGGGAGQSGGRVRRRIRRTPATLIKVVRYPATAASSQGVGAHRDSGVLTLLLAEPGSAGSAGARADGHPMAAGSTCRARDGAFIVNIGELLEFATGGYLRATEHRVNLRQSADRISVPYFFNPRLDAQIPVLSLPAELARQAERRDGPVRPDLPGVWPQRVEEQAAGASGCRRSARLRDGQTR